MDCNIQFGNRLMGILCHICRSGRARFSGTGDLISAQNQEELARVDRTTEGKINLIPETGRDTWQHLITVMTSMAQPLDHLGVTCPRKRDAVTRIRETPNAESVIC